MEQSAFIFYVHFGFASYVLPYVQSQSELFNANLDLHTRANSDKIKRMAEEFNSYWLEIMVSTLQTLFNMLQYRRSKAFKIKTRIGRKTISFDGL